MEMYSVHFQSGPFCDINICAPEPGRRNECPYWKSLYKALFEKEQCIKSSFILQTLSLHRALSYIYKDQKDSPWCVWPHNAEDEMYKQIILGSYV